MNLYYTYVAPNTNVNIVEVCESLQTKHTCMYIADHSSLRVSWLHSMCWGGSQEQMVALTS
jgi:hypothetical protein